VGGRSWFPLWIVPERVFPETRRKDKDGSGENLGGKPEPQNGKRNVGFCNDLSELYSQKGGGKRSAKESRKKRQNFTLTGGSGGPHQGERKDEKLCLWSKGGRGHGVRSEVMEMPFVSRIQRNLRGSVLGSIGKEILVGIRGARDFKTDEAVPGGVAPDKVIVSTLMKGSESLRGSQRWGQLELAMGGRDREGKGEGVRSARVRYSRPVHLKGTGKGGLLSTVEHG